MRNKFTTPPWVLPSLFSPKTMYELSITKRGLIRGLKCDKEHYARMMAYQNLHLINGLPMTMRNGFPKVHSYSGSVDFNYVPVTKWNRKIGDDVAIHGFGEDIDLERKLWKHLEITTKLIKDCKLLVAPDFSLFVDPWLVTFNKMQVWKSRVVTAFWQACGLNVVPLVSWGNADSFDYCLEGLPTNSVLALSATCCHHCKGALSLWQYAVSKIVSTLQPKSLLIYGDPEMGVNVDVPIKFIPDYIHSKLRNL